jgi:hypothetical protein
MQEDTDLTLYIGVTNNCDEAVVNDVNECCQLLTSINSNGGQLLLVNESNLNYRQTDLLIDMKRGDAFLTNRDSVFNIRLARDNSLYDVLYALTASWFLSTQVCHGFSDYIMCFKVGNSLQLDIIETNNADDLRSFLSAKKRDVTLTAIICNIEAIENNITIEWFEEIGNALKSFIGDDTYFVMSVSTRAIQQSNSKIYLTWFYK